MGIPHYHSPSDDTSAVITIAAIPGGRIEIESIQFAYDEDPAAGKALTVESPSGTTIWKTYVTKGGPGNFDFSGSCLRGGVSSALIITLAAGGTGIAGSVGAIQRQS